MPLTPLRSTKRCCRHTSAGPRPVFLRWWYTPRLGTLEKSVTEQDQRPGALALPGLL